MGIVVGFDAASADAYSAPHVALQNINAATIITVGVVGCVGVGVGDGATESELGIRRGLGLYLGNSLNL